MPKTKPFDENIEQYESWFKKNKFAYKSELKAIKKMIPINKQGIEIGIGSGLFAKQLGIKTGVEPSEEMRKLSQKRGLKVYDGVGENLPIESASFDFALIVTTICFLDDVEKSFKEIYRILKSDGFFIIGFVDKESSLGKIYQKFKNENIFYKIARFFSTNEVLKLLEKSNFSAEKIVQTVFGNLSKIYNVQEPKEGFGKGGFVVIKAIK